MNGGFTVLNQRDQLVSGAGACALLGSAGNCAAALDHGSVATSTATPAPQSRFNAAAACLGHFARRMRARGIVKMYSVNMNDVSVLDTDLEREWRVMVAVDASGVPMPRLFGCEGTRDVLGYRFITMGWIDGEAPNPWRRASAARLHAWALRGLPCFTGCASWESSGILNCFNMPRVTGY